MTSWKQVEPSTLPLSGSPAVSGLHSIIDDAKADEADLIPLALIYPSTPASDLFDYAAEAYGGGDGEGFIYQIGIGGDIGTTRDAYDRTSAFADLDPLPNVVRHEIGEEYYCLTAEDLTAELPGLILIVDEGTNTNSVEGGLREPAVPANTTPDVIAFGYSLVDAVSTTIARVKFLGLIHVDDSA